MQAVDHGVLAPASTYYASRNSSVEDNSDVLRSKMGSMENRFEEDRRILQ